MKAKGPTINEQENITHLMEILKEYPVIKKAWKIFFRGRSFDFETYRDYGPDDDAANIDWIGSVRASKLVVKQYRDQEPLTVIIGIDVGDTMVLGSGKKLKCEYAGEIALALVYLILSTNSRVGFFLYSNKIIQFYPPSKGKRVFYSFKDALTNPRSYGGRSSLSEASDFLVTLPPYPLGAAIFLSDFLSVQDNDGPKLSVAETKFEIVSIMIKDKLDVTLPEMTGEFLLEGNDGQQMIVDPSLAKNAYEKYSKEKEIRIKKLFEKRGVDIIDFMTDESFADRLASFLKERVRRGGFRR